VPSQILNRNWKFLTQSVLLTGLNTPTFNAALESIALIHKQFLKSLPAGRLRNWNPGSFQQWPTVTISNRYFSKSSTASKEAIKLDKLVDPEGILASSEEYGYVHTAENQVGYFMLTKELDAKSK
jgi:hypothetical protein